MNFIRGLIFRNRDTVLATTILVYLLVVVVEGALTGREARVIDLENPFFDFNIGDLDQLRQLGQDQDEDFQDRRN